MFIFIDINECEIKGVCGVGGECTNEEGTYQCECSEGFTLHNNFCKGIEKLPYFLFKRRPQFFLTVY